MTDELEERDARIRVVADNAAQRKAHCLGGTAVAAVHRGGHLENVSLGYTDWWTDDESNDIPPTVQHDFADCSSSRFSFGHTVTDVAALRSRRAENDARIAVEFEHVLRQPRGQRHKQPVINELRNSYEQYGFLSPVLMDAQGDRIIDGRHRKEINPDWPEHWLKDVTTDEQAIAAIIELDTWHQKGSEKLSANAREKIIAIQGKAATQSQIKRARIESELRADPARSNHQLAQLLGVTDVLVMKVRDELLTVSTIHRYEFRGGGAGRRPGEHSAECWCGEGEAKPLIMSTRTVFNPIFFAACNTWWPANTVPSSSATMERM
jgi:hypothetical protein